MGDVDLPSKGKIFVIFNWVSKVTNIGAELDLRRIENLKERNELNGQQDDICISSRNEVERRNQLPLKEASYD